MTTVDQRAVKDLEHAKFRDTPGGVAVAVDIQDASVIVQESVPDTSYTAQSIIVGTSQVALPASPLANRKLIIIENKSGANIFYGPSGVTTTTGVRLPNNAIVSIAIGPSILLYALRAAGSGDVTVQEVA
jgi:hypothetical protein